MDVHIGRVLPPGTVLGAEIGVAIMLCFCHIYFTFSRQIQML